MKLLHSLPYTKDGVTHPVGKMNVPKSLVSTFKASLLTGMGMVELRITPGNRQEEIMPVYLPTFDVVGVSVYEDGEDKLVQVFREE